ncbi:MAG: TSUP family transporter, partial [Gammaproteobacteria bacterium]|nr:TSUP family transporter [Gammaproteobacteria bacterium]
MLLHEAGFWVVAWCFAALLSGGLVKGALGVGTPLLPVPLMSLVLPPQLAVAMMAMPVVVANLLQVSEAGHPGYTVRRFWPAFVFLLAGTWIGVKV